MPLGKWEKKGSEYMLKTPWLSVRKDAYVTPQGKYIDDFYILERKDFIVIVPQTDDGKFILVSQYRHGIEEEIINFPMGFVEEDELPQKTAERELTEETSYVSQKMKLIGSFYVEPPLRKTIFHIFSATGCTKASQSTTIDTDEISTCVLKTKSEMEEAIRSKKLNDANSVFSYLLATK